MAAGSAAGGTRPVSDLDICFFFVDFPNSGILACLRCLLSSLSHNGMVNNGMEVLLLINVFLVHICYLSNQQLHGSFIEVIYFRSAPHAKFEK